MAGSTFSRVRSQIGNTNLALLASGVAFWAILSIFPALIAVLLVYGRVVSPAQAAHEVNSLAGSLSPDTKAVLQRWLTGVTTSGGSLVGLVITLAGLLWSVSSGMQNLIKATTAAYEQEEDRHFVPLRLLAIVLSIGAIVVAILALAAIGVGPALQQLVSNQVLRVLVEVGSWLVLALILFGAIATLYRVAPARRPTDRDWIVPGALLATVLVVIASIAFSFYVRFFAHYNKTYGALGGVIILMVWLYYVIYIVLIGALVNAERERQATGATSASTYPVAAPDADR